MLGLSRELGILVKKECIGYSYSESFVRQSQRSGDSHDGFSVVVLLFSYPNHVDYALL